MEGICQSPPSKLLHTGADLLLTAAFRGVYDSKGRGLDREVLLSGSHPLTDDELGLCPLLDEGTGTSSADTQGLNWLPESLDDEMIKGDHQKANNAAVPDHLWLRAFAMGYGDPAYPARHLEALNLPPLTSRVGFLAEPGPPAGWRGALPGLRLFALRHWRSRVT